jgi:integrase
MTAFTASAADAVPPDHVLLRAATAAHLGRYRNESRDHTESDQRVFLRWCTDQDLDPLSAVRADIERYLRWLQDIRRYQPSTVSRRLSVVVGFYRTCVIDQILPHSPPVPADSPTLGLGHLQFEALITAARLSANPNDFALVALLGLLGLRIFEGCGANIEHLGEEHGIGSCAYAAKAAKSYSSHCHQRSPAPSTEPSTAATPARSCGTSSAPAWTATPPPGGSNTSPTLPVSACRACTRTCCGILFVTTMLDAGLSLRDVQIAARHADPRTTMRYDRARRNLDRHPNYILAAYMASGT